MHQGRPGATGAKHLAPGTAEHARRGHPASSRGQAPLRLELRGGRAFRLRQSDPAPFCRVYLHRVPDDTTLLRWANLEPATLVSLNERVVALAGQLKVTRGRKLRVDSTVVETTIHHPSDSSLLGDGVHVLSRLLRRAKTALKETTELGKAVFRTRTCSARRLVQSLHRLGRRKGEAARQAMRTAYTRLIAVAQKTRAQAARVCAVLQTRRASPGRPGWWRATGACSRARMRLMPSRSGWRAWC